MEELEALLLLEELPEEDADELPELERERDLLELPALLCDDELHRSINISGPLLLQLVHTTPHLERLRLALSLSLSLPRGGVRLRELDRLLLLLSLLRLLLRSLTPLQYLYNPAEIYYNQKVPPKVPTT